MIDPVNCEMRARTWAGRPEGNRIDAIAHMIRPLAEEKQLPRYNTSTQNFPCVIRSAEKGGAM